MTWFAHREAAEFLIFINSFYHLQLRPKINLHCSQKSNWMRLSHKPNNWKKKKHLTVSFTNKGSYWPTNQRLLCPHFRCFWPHQLLFQWPIFTNFDKLHIGETLGHCFISPVFRNFLMPECGMSANTCSAFKHDQSGSVGERMPRSHP